MRPVSSFHLSYPDVRALRIALAAGAVAGLVVIAACTDNGGKAITAPTAPRLATTSSGGFGNAKHVDLCVDASSPAGDYTFVNTNENVGIALTGNGFLSGGVWYDQGDGGDGTTVFNAASGTPYTVTAGGSCVRVVDRTVGDAAFMAVPKIRDIDSWAAATITYNGTNTAVGGAQYNHTDCLNDLGVLIPQQASPPALWPAPGYPCGNSNNPTRAFANFEHGTVITFVFSPPPILTECTLGYPDNSNLPRSNVVFNESEVLRAFGLVSGRIHAWYNDEHALTLGVDSVFVNNKVNPDFGFSYPIEKMSSWMTGATTAGVNKSPSTVLVGRASPPADPPVGEGNPVDGAGRPLYPALFLTDLTALGVSSRAGDWQQGGTGLAPNRVYGSWKGAVVTVNKTVTPTKTTITPKADPAKNHNNYGPGGTPAAPALAVDQGWGSDIVWNLADLGLIAGHDYRAQFMVHDGDQNKSGGDVGQACVNIDQ